MSKIKFQIPLLLTLLLLFSVALLPLSCRTSEDTFLVSRVIDGDTIVLEGGEHVRYIGIDTPETGRPYYPEAKKANEELVLGKRVRMHMDVSDRDRYERLLRYVYADGTFVNAELVRRGLARAKAYPPDTKYQKELAAIEKGAALQGDGLWSAEPSLPGKR